jgi:hypothetical protein
VFEEMSNTIISDVKLKFWRLLENLLPHRPQSISKHLLMATPVFLYDAELTWFELRLALTGLCLLDKIGLTPGVFSSLLTGEISDFLFFGLLMKSSIALAADSSICKE